MKDPTWCSDSVKGRAIACCPTCKLGVVDRKASVFALGDGIAAVSGKRCCHKIQEGPPCHWEAGGVDTGHLYLNSVMVSLPSPASAVVMKSRKDPRACICDMTFSVHQMSHLAHMQANLVPEHGSLARFSGGCSYFVSVDNTAGSCGTAESTRVDREEDVFIHIHITQR